MIGFEWRSSVTSMARFHAMGIYPISFYFWSLTLLQSRGVEACLHTLQGDGCNTVTCRWSKATQQHIPQWQIWYDEYTAQLAILSWDFQLHDVTSGNVTSRPCCLHLKGANSMAASGLVAWPCLGSSLEATWLALGGPFLSFWHKWS